MTLAAQFPYTADLLPSVYASLFPFPKWYRYQNRTEEVIFVVNKPMKLKGTFLNIFI